MGRSGRRRPRQEPRRSPRGWRATLDSFGGPLTVGPIGGVVVLVLVLIVLSQRTTSPPPAEGPPYEPVVRHQVKGRLEGDPSARIRIVEFSDFQ